MFKEELRTFRSSTLTDIKMINNMCVWLVSTIAMV